MSQRMRIEKRAELFSALQNARGYVKRSMLTVLGHQQRIHLQPIRRDLSQVYYAHCGSRQVPVVCCRG